MNTEKLTPAHKVFIAEMVRGVSQKQAYMNAYPGSSVQAAYSSASRLMDKPHIRREIEQQTELIAWTKQEIMAGQYAGRLVTISKQREALTAAFDKKHTKEETITNFKGQARHRIAFDLRQRIDAIKLDERLYKEWNKLMDDIKDGDMISSVMTQIHALKEPAIARAVADYSLPADDNFFSDEEMQDDKNSEKEVNFLAIPSKNHQDVAAIPSKNHQSVAAIPSKNHQGVAAIRSNTIEKVINSCGKNHQDVAAGLSMSDKDNGNSEEESPENAEIPVAIGTCETLANEDSATVKKEPAQHDTRHMNRKQRRAAEQYRKRLAEKEEKLRILLHS